jgi:hypothetical protein
VLAAPNTGTRIFYLVMTTLTGYWFLRCWRAGVVLDDAAVVLRGQIRTRRVAWADIDSPTLLTMRTASPLKAKFPYMSLGLRLKNGRVVRFDDLAAPGSHPVRVEMVVTAIAQRLRVC